MAKRTTFFIIINMLAVFLFVTLSFTTDFRLRHDPLLYLVLLFFFCSIPILLSKELNGSYCIILILSPIYFIFYGFTDLISYIYAIPAMSLTRGYSLAEEEIAILVGWLMMLIGYSITASSFNKKKKIIQTDWTVKSLILVGVVCIFIGLYSTWVYQLGANDRYDIRREQLGALQGMIVIGGRMLEPVGFVLLVYAYLKHNTKALLYLILGVCIVKIPLAFILDSKEIALQNPIIFFAAKWLYDGKVPVRWAVIFFVVISLLFPLFYAYRSAVLDAGTTRQKALSNMASNIDKTLKKSGETSKEGKLQSGIISFTGRMNLKPLMLLVVSKTGHGVPYQDGYTLSLLLYALIPRVILPDKPDSSVGQLFNRQYRISENPDTYISTSFLAELYWNHGWVGIVIGMFIIGSSFGFIGAKANIVDKKSVTQLLILISTIYLLCFRFEAGIAIQYTQWIRSLLIIYFLHKIFSRPVKNKVAINKISL